MRKVLVAIVALMLFINSPAWGQDAMYFYNLGLESSMANRKIHYFTKALELNPSLSVAYEKRGLLYYFQEKYPEMLNDFEKVTELEPLKSEAHLMLGLAHMKQRSFEEALASLTRAIELDPQLAGAYSHRAETYRLKGMVDEAIQDSTRAIKLGGTEQERGKAHTTRAKAYMQLGRSELADADLKKALKYDLSFFFYLHPTSTDFLASFVTDPNYVDSAGIRKVGLFGIIALLFVLIFKLALPSPNKRDDS